MSDSSPELSFTLNAANAYGDDDDDEPITLVLASSQPVRFEPIHDEQQLLIIDGTTEQGGLTTAQNPLVATAFRLPQQQTNPTFTIPLPTAILNKRNNSMLAVFKLSANGNEYKIYTFDVFTDTVNLSEGEGSHKDLPKLLPQLPEAGLHALRQLMDGMAEMENKGYAADFGEKKMFYYWVIRSLSIHDGEHFSVGLCRYVHTPAQA